MPLKPDYEPTCKVVFFHVQEERFLNMCCWCLSHVCNSSSSASNSLCDSIFNFLHRNRHVKSDRLLINYRRKSKQGFPSVSKLRQHVHFSLQSYINVGRDVVIHQVAQPIELLLRVYEFESAVPIPRIVDGKVVEAATIREIWKFHNVNKEYTRKFKCMMAIRTATGYLLARCFSTGVPPKQTEIAWDESRNHSCMRF